MRLPGIRWQLALLCAAAASGSAQQTEEAVRLLTQTGASTNLMALAFSRDARLLITGGGDHEALVWRVEGAKQIAVLRGHTNYVGAVAFLPDGTRAVTGSIDQTARVWDLRTAREIRQWAHPAPVFAVSVSPDGGLIATAAAQFIYFWDVASGTLVRKLEGHSGNVLAVAFSPDGKLLASASVDKTARLWDVASGRELRSFNGHESQVNTVAFSPDGATLATGSGPQALIAGQGDLRTRVETALAAEHTIRLWKVDTGDEIRGFDAPAAIRSVAFAPNGRYLAAGGGVVPSGNIANGVETRVFELATGREVAKIPVEPRRPHYPVEAVAFSPDSALLARTDFDQVAVTGAAGFAFRGYAAQTDYFALSPNGRYAYTGAQVWNLETGQAQNLAGFRPGGGGAFSGDGMSLATLGTGGDFRIFDLPGARQRGNDASLGKIMATAGLAFSPDGKQLLAGGFADDASWRLLDAALGVVLRTFPSKYFFPHNPVFFSPAGDAVVISDMYNRVTHVFETTTGKELRSFPMASPALAPVGPDQVAMASGKQTFIWNWTTGVQVRALDTGPAGSVAVSQDGRWLAVGPQRIGVANRIHVWDLIAGTEAWSAPDWSAEGLAFSADSRFLLTSGHPGTSYVYEAATGKQVCSFVGFIDGTWAVTDNEGRYDTSNPDGAIGLHWVAGDEVIELGQLKQRFYTPGLLARILRGERLPEVAGIQTVKLFPAVQAQAPTPGSSRLEIQLTDRGGGLGRVAVRVNGKEIAADTRGAAHLSVDLAGAARAPDGNNSIEIVAYDAAGMLSSRGVRVRWVTPVETARPQRLFALVAGASEYDNPALNLKYAAKDAADFAHALQLGAQRLLGADRVSVRLLSTAQAGAARPTKEEFRKAVDQIASDAQSQDVFVLYLAGHGVARSGAADQYYFLTSAARSTEVPANDAAMLDRATVSAQELEQWCKRIPALKQVIVLDTCAAGAANRELLKLAEPRELSPDQIRALELLKDSTGSHVLMGSAADAVSYEAGRYGQGLLTYALLEGFKGAALDDGNRVDVRKLFDFAQRQVEQLAAGIGGIQRPIVSSPEGQSFPIGLVTEEDKRAIVLALPKPQVLRASCLNADDADPLGLTALVRALLRDAAQPIARGGAADPPLVYLDSVVDDLPSALIPRIRYEAHAGKLEVRMRLFEDAKPVADARIETSAEPAAAAREITAAILKAAAEWKPY